MASGLPDYYRGVDIAYQALAQVTNRPKYGGALELYGSVVVTANFTTGLAEVSGKGMIYGGLVYLDPTATQASGIPGVIVDGNVIAGITFTRMNKYNVSKSWAYPLYLLSYDDVNFVYSCAASYGITFESSFKLVYNEAEGATPRVYYDFVYALI